MELLLWIGLYTLYFIVQTLTALYFAAIGGVGLAAGFHFFRSWRINKREKKNLKEAEKAFDEIQQKSPVPA